MSKADTLSVERAVVVVCGNAGHGKDTFGLALQDALLDRGVLAKVRAFSDPLKRTAHEMIGIPLSVLYGTQEEKARPDYYGRSARQWLQWLGTNVGREQVDVNLWTNRAAEVVGNDADRPAVTIFTDGRFRNEFERGGQFWLSLGRNGGFRLRSVLVRRHCLPVNADHPSEAGIATVSPDEFDYAVLDAQNLEEVDVRADRIADQLIRELGL